MSVNIRETISDPVDPPRLRKRINIFIQRTDGRVHEGSVSDIDYEKQMVIVEWIENGETKGKSVEFPVVFELNPDLRLARKSLEQDTTKGSDLSTAMNPDLLFTQETHVDMETTSGNDVSSDVDAEEEELDDEAVDDDDEDDDDDVLMVNVPASNDVLYEEPYEPEPPPIAQQEERDNTMGTSRMTMHLRGAPPMRDRKSGVSPRRRLPGNQAPMSNCVRQIKKLEQNRMERRLRLEEAKQEKQKQMNADRNGQFLAMIRDFRSSVDIDPLVISDVAHDKEIVICVRKRPFSKKEEQMNEVDVITVPAKDTMIIHNCKQKVDQTKFLDNQSFRFDYVFDEDATNEMVYKFTAQPLIQTIFDGGMATCFAYGQTGSGKTHTLGGSFSRQNHDCATGVYVFAARDIFKYLQKSKYKKEDMSVRASFFEIYNGQVFDLLNKKKKLHILEDNQSQVQVVGLQEREAKSMEDVLHLIQQGDSVRSLGQTASNQHSSRSHAVFQIILRQKSGVLHGKFSFIDLAGSERGVDTMRTDRKRRLEGAETNESLLALKKCIRALARKDVHVPFRYSLLTKVLRDSLVGQNSRTCMIAMVSPGMSCSEHTLNTLRYAHRVKELDGSGNGKEISVSSPTTWTIMWMNMLAMWSRLWRTVMRSND